MTANKHTFEIQRGSATPVSDVALPVLNHFVGGQFDGAAAGSGSGTSGGAAAGDMSAGETFDLIDPAKGTRIATVPVGSVADVQRAVGAASQAKESWGPSTPAYRADLLNQVADRLAAHREEIAALEAWNTGKPIATARDDVDGTVDVFRFSAGAARAFTELGTADYVEGHTSMIVREPLGVVGAVVPWNYPLLMGAWKIAPILAAGNTLVLKPSEQTPLSLLKFAELTADILPAGVFNLVMGTGPVVGNALAEHPDIDMVALTGSVGSGKSVARAASDSLKRVHLELGGKAPVVVFADADLPKVAKGLRAAGYYNSGQECGAGTRVLVDRAIADQFLDVLAAEVAEIQVGEPGAGEDIEVGPVFSKRHYDRVLGFIDRALADGARAAVGGGALDGDGYFIAPTVLADVAPGSEASQQEIFGPVVTVETFETEDEAVTRANEVPYGLSASVWTQDISRAMDVVRRIDAGTVWVNCHLVLANDVPWGGFKGSGYGRDLSIYALQDYSRTKHVQINHER